MPMSDPRAALLPASGSAPSVLAVHAHPDDETLATGMALAQAVLLGGRSHVITCTLGEEGEVIPAELSHLEGDPGLAEHRHQELAGALAALGATGSYLGGERPRWRDSGMAGTSAAAHPRAFASAEVNEAAALLADQIRRIRPDILLTYDATGGYEHPDHLQTHRVTLAAWRSLSAPERPELFLRLTPRSWLDEERDWLAEHVPADLGVHVEGHDDPVMSSVVPDDQVTHDVHDPAAAQIRDEALVYHRTQVRVFDGFFALSNDIAARLADREGYTRVE